MHSSAPRTWSSLSGSAEGEITLAPAARVVRVSAGLLPKGGSVSSTTRRSARPRTTATVPAPDASSAATSTPSATVATVAALGNTAGFFFRQPPHLQHPADPAAATGQRKGFAQ